MVIFATTKNNMQMTNESKLDNDVQSFLKTSLDVIKRYGLVKGINHLNASVKNIEIDDVPKKKIDKIFKIVSSETGVPISELHKRSTSTTIDAKQIAYCLIKEVLKLSFRKIAGILYINKSSIIQATTRLKNANPNVKVDKNFLDAYEQCKSKTTSI
jgi:chromosomal replication initiation ATPase DnaA